MAMPAVQITRPVPATTVKNTFIDLPVTPAGGNAYVLASAPARGAPTIKESLAAAASSPEGEQATAFGNSPNRPKPQALSAISEAPTFLPAVQGMPVVTTVTPQMSGQHSIPATPQMEWQCMATPTGTPLGPASRTTLSLVSMIQSPKAEEKATILGGAYQQLVYQPTYAAQPMTTVAPPQYVAQVPTAAAPTMPQYQVPQLVTHQAPQHPPAPPPAAAPSLTASLRAPGGRPTIEVPPPGEAEAAGPPMASTASPLAAVKLGLVAGGPPRAVQTYSSPVRAQMPVLPAVQYTVQAGGAVAQLPPATFGGTVHAAAPIVYTQPQAASVSSPQKFVPPPPLAPAPTVLATPKGYMPMPKTPTGMPAGVAVMFAAPPATTVQPMAPAGPSAPPQAPPPQVAPQVAAPAGSGTGMSAADLKVLLDMAVASGNQQAIDALLRQAQAAGMSAEEFNAMLPAKQA